MTSLYAHIEARAKAHPTETALMSCRADGSVIETITNRELLERVTSAGAFLLDTGLARGDRVALDLSHPLEFLTVSWAAWALGIAIVPLDAKRDTGETREYKVSVSDAKIVIANIAYTEPRHSLPWVSDTAHEALVLFTSGTTARPKGAMLSLHNLTVNADGLIRWLRIEERDRFFVCLPLYHINSTTFCLATLLSGGSIVTPPSYSNSGFWRQLAQTGATFTSIVQSIVHDQLEQKESFRAVEHELRVSRIQVGSAPVVAASARAFIREFHIPLYQGYGQTETALRVTGVPMGLSPSLYERLVDENSIGTAMPWADIQVVDEHGKVLGEGTEGELVVRGDAVMKGYVAGEPAFRDGYFLTGDIGLYRIIEGTPYFYLKGRKKEIIIKGGVNISPVAIEDSLQRFSPDITQAYAIGVPDERYGEEVGAVICLKPDIEPEEALRRLKVSLLFTQGVLSAYERPRYIALYRAQDLPMTSTGKVQRTRLKELVTPAQFESVDDLLATGQYRFSFVGPQSLYAEASRELHNQCWHPLVQAKQAYREYLKKNHTIAAIGSDGKIAGQVSFTLDTSALICTSICRAGFVPKPVPVVAAAPPLETVRRYVEEGRDPVIRFHTERGAKVVEIIPNGRPEDASSCGYTVLLSYPATGNSSLEGPVSHQLITVARKVAEDLGLPVQALSRPGGLASYISKNSMV